MLKRIGHWLKERWPFSALVHLALDEEIPGGSRFTYALGSALLTVFALQATTGILQLFYYVPTVDHAYDSVNYLRTKVAFGWLINGLHYWGANAMVVLAALHITRVFSWGAYKHPRELTWLLGVSLLLLIMALSFTGGPLSWDQRAYFEAEVGTSMPGSIPVMGDTIKRIMRGGDEMGQLTLSRLFIVHTAILPATLAALIAAHLIAFRSFGSVGPWDETRRAIKGPFWPDQVFKDALVSILIILTLVTLVVFAPKAFNGAADPLDSSFIPKPEWNFLFLYEALKFFPGKLEPIGVAGVPQVFVLLLVLVPFIDRRTERNPFKRPVAMACGTLFAGVIIGLTVAGHYSKPEGAVPSPAPLSAPGASSAAQIGAQLFQSQGCIGCHRVNNTGGTVGPDLSQEGSLGRSKEWLITQIRNPKSHFPGSVMPAFTALSDQDVNALVAYLLSLKGNVVPEQAKTPVKPSEPNNHSETRNTQSPAQEHLGSAAYIIGSVERGGLLFNMECTSCHGPDGTDKVPNPGSDDGKVPELNPIDREIFSKDPQLFAQNIDRFLQHGSTPEGPGPALRMPAFGDSNSLTQQQIANAEAYLLHLNGVDRAQIQNPGMLPKRFFIIVVPVVVIVLLILGGIYKCLP